MLRAESFPALLFLVSSLLVAESPRWLVEKGRMAEAQVVLKRINGLDIAAGQLRDISVTVMRQNGSLSEP